MGDDNTEVSSPNGDAEEYNPRVRWAAPQRVRAARAALLGRDALALALGAHVACLHLRSGAEHVYHADGGARGDGVDAIAGHKSNIFAFAEKVQHPRIFIVMYPTFAILAELKDAEVTRYKGLCLMEGDLVAAFGGFPDHLLCVWNWRSGQRLRALRQPAPSRHQLFAASRSHALLCQCWGAGLAVWELAPCYRRCEVLRRAWPARTPAPALRAVCWAGDGALYALDCRARLYAVASDGVDMVLELEWAEELPGAGEPLLCALGAGLLVYGPDERLRWLKKAERAWRVCWDAAPADAVELLVASAAGDAAVAWTRDGRAYRLLAGDDDRPDFELFAFKQRHIIRVELIAPDYVHVATLCAAGVLCVYELSSGRLLRARRVAGRDACLAASPAEPLLALAGAGAGAQPDYGLALVQCARGELREVPEARTCLTHQIVSHVAFSPSGQELVAAAMSAGHVFVFRLSERHALLLTRYAELGRALADCALLPVGAAGTPRALCLVLCSDKYAIGERIVCINAETGKDNKFAGKMQGPYAQLTPLRAGAALGAPAAPRARRLHELLLGGDKGATVSVKMGLMVDSGHDLRHFRAFRNENALLTFGADGAAVLRRADALAQPELKLPAAHRYEGGVLQARVDARGGWLVALSPDALLVTQLRAPRDPPPPPPPALGPLDVGADSITIVEEDDKNYLDLVEERAVRAEAQESRRAREAVVATVAQLRARLLRLLQHNLAAPPLHRLSLAEFNLHQEAKRERLKQAEREREEIRLRTEARVRAQDAVTAWIKRTCWDVMLTPRIKLLAIFSHYQVENYPVLPTQRELWPELRRAAALRGVEQERDAELFRPWEEAPRDAPSGAAGALGASRASLAAPPGASRASLAAPPGADAADAPDGSPHVLAGSSAHELVALPHYMIPQTLAFSFLQMNWLQEIVKLNVQNVRLWFNKQFDELYALKRRELGLVAERHARLRVVVSELNKLSDLRGSFHHLLVPLRDPEWRQEERPQDLIKVDPEECSIAPYVSPSQVVVPPPEARPKDDFRERALNEMMDGVLEKLWHEEIKKPVPKPQCMLDKAPEQFAEEDLRQVFEYEARVAARERERHTYRTMLHAEYARLAQQLSEGVGKFNARVKDAWLTKLRVDSVIAQENLNLMRLRRVNLDRVEAAERLEQLRAQSSALATRTDALQRAQARLQAQGADVQAAHDALAQRDRHMERSFKNHFADLSPVVVDQCYKFFKKRPKWHQRAAMIPGVLYELASGVLSGVRPPLLHADCVDYFKAVEQLDHVGNMPPVLDEGLWATMCRLRRAKIENEIRMRALVLEMVCAEGAAGAWARAAQAHRARAAATAQSVAALRARTERDAVNRTVQLVLPAGQVEVAASGRAEDFEDATLIPREDIDKMNNLILRVGEMKLRMMRRQMEFRKGILAKEWEHAQAAMRLRHLQQELHSYRRLRVPKELQRHLRERQLGRTDEQEHRRLEKEMEATRVSFGRVLGAHVQRAEELEVKLAAVRAKAARVERVVRALNVQLSEKRLQEDPLEPIRVRRVLKRRMASLAARARLVRDVQRNHARAALLHTELELLRLKTFPTLATFRTFC